MTFVASTGDAAHSGGLSGLSPNVVAAGGTEPSDGFTGQLPVGDGLERLGRRTPQVESQPTYQNGVVTQSAPELRTDPDVAFDADPSTGVSDLRFVQQRDHQSHGR